MNKLYFLLVPAKICNNVVVFDFFDFIYFPLLFYD